MSPQGKRNWTNAQSRQEPTIFTTIVTGLSPRLFTMKLCQDTHIFPLHWKNVCFKIVCDDQWEDCLPHDMNPTFVSVWFKKALSIIFKLFHIICYNFMSYIQECSTFVLILSFLLDLGGAIRSFRAFFGRPYQGQCHHTLAAPVVSLHG